VLVCVFIYLALCCALCFNLFFCTNILCMFIFFICFIIRFVSMFLFMNLVCVCFICLLDVSFSLIIYGMYLIVVMCSRFCGYC
jgi:hypothetical protein